MPGQLVTTPGGFPYQQFPHPFAGSNSERQSVGDPGHCEDCVSVGHLVALPDLGCGDVGCTNDHSQQDEPATDAATLAEPAQPEPGSIAAERAEREQAKAQLAAMTAPATYVVGDYVTFVLVANVTATVQITELTAAGSTSYAFSNGQIGGHDNHRVLSLWRPASAAEIELYQAHAVDRLGERIALPRGDRW